MKGKKEQLLHLMKESPFDRHLDYVLEDVQEGCVRMSLYMKAEIFQNSRGAVHGGALYGFSGILMGAACASLGKNTTTMGLQISYLRPAKVDSRVVGIARVRQSGEKMIRAECEFHDEEGRSLAHCEGTFFVLQKRPMNVGRAQ